MTEAPDQTKDRLRRRVTNLADVHSKRISPAGIDRWVERLAPHDGPMLDRVLDRALDGDSMPALTEVLDRYWAEKRRAAPAPNHRMSDDERALSDLAAVKSIMWLVWNHPKAIDMLNGNDILARHFGCAPQDAVAIGRERYPHGIVNHWMDDQERAGELTMEAEAIAQMFAIEVIDEARRTKLPIDIADIRDAIVKALRHERHARKTAEQAGRRARISQKVRDRGF